jgi:putative phosphoribosyl transferase
LAVAVAKKNAPKEIVVATPVAPESAVQEIEQMGAKVLVLEPQESFRGSVGAHYVYFPQLKDKEVIRLLEAAK